MIYYKKNIIKNIKIIKTCFYDILIIKIKYAIIHVFNYLVWIIFLIIN